MWRIMREIAHEPLTTRLYSWVLVCSLAFWVGAYGAYGIQTIQQTWQMNDGLMSNSGNAYASSIPKLQRTPDQSDPSKIRTEIKSREYVSWNHSE